MGRARSRMGVVVILACLFVACGSASPPRAVRDTATTTVPLTTTPTPTTAAPPATPAGPTTTGRPTTTVPPATRVDLLDPQLAQAGSAGQVVVVTAPRYGATTATLTAYERDGASWRRAFGPWPARVGTRGLAPPGEKREGDGRTPSGVYGFDFFFGVSADPGVRFEYRRVTGPSIVWDDDPASPLYNTWVDLDRQRAGADPEPMYTTPAYDHGAVVAYCDDAVVVVAARV